MQREAGAAVVEVETGYPHDGRVRITVTEDGRVYGHLALKDTCHTGFGDQCVTAPSSATGYAYFHLGEVDTTAGISFGRTVHDIWHLSGKPRNVQVAMDADSPRFFELLRRCIARLR